MNATIPLPTVDECVANIEKSNAGVEIHRFNCWSFTSFLMGWMTKVEWMNESTILHLLKEHARQVDNLQPGDIIGFFYYWDTDDDPSPFSHGISHTAVYLGDNQILHKPGGLPIAIDDLQKATDYYGTVIRFFRRMGA